MEVNVIGHEAQWSSLRGEWDRLLDRSDHESPFLSFDWIDLWWRYFGSGQLRIVTLQETGELVAAAPFYQMTGPGGMQVLKLMGSGPSDYLDVLVPAGRADELTKGLLGGIAEHGGWDVILLEQVPPKRLAAIRDEIKRRGFLLQIKPRGHCYALALPSRWDEFLAGLSANERYNIRRRTRTMVEAQRGNGDAGQMHRGWNPTGRQRV